MFQPEVLSSDADAVDIKFHACPLREAWQEAGLPEEQVAMLCRIAARIDNGTFEGAGFDFFADTWRPKTEGCCCLHIRPRQAFADAHNADIIIISLFRVQTDMTPRTSPSGPEPHSARFYALRLLRHAGNSRRAHAAFWPGGTAADERCDGRQRQRDWKTAASPSGWASISATSIHPTSVRRCRSSTTARR